MSQSYISDLISGARGSPTVEVALKLEVALGEPRARLTHITDGMPEPVGLEEFLASPLAADVTDEERAFLRLARWVPTGRKASLRDWGTFLGVLRNLQKENGDKK